MEKLYQNKDWLENQYIVLRRSAPQIAKEFKMGKSTIYRWLKGFGIPIRTKSEVLIGNQHNKGKHHSEESKKKISESNKGKKLSEEIKGKISKTKMGDKNPAWKGDNVGLKAIHMWIAKHKPKPEICEICGEKKKLELSSKTHEYTRDLEEYRWLCRSCHMKYDYEKGFRIFKGNNYAYRGN